MAKTTDWAPCSQEEGVHHRREADTGEEDTLLPANKGVLLRGEAIVAQRGWRRDTPGQQNNGRWRLLRNIKANRDVLAAVLPEEDALLPFTVRLVPLYEIIEAKLRHGELILELCALCN